MTVSFATAPPLSAARVMAVMEESQDDIFIIDRRNIVEYMNPPAYRALGFSAAPVGRPLRNCFSSSAWPEIEQDINHARRAQRPVYRERSIPFAQRERWMGAWLTPIDDDNGERTSVMGIARDITQRHELAQLLAEQHNLFEALITASPIGILLLNGASDWMCELSNPVARQMAGATWIDGAGLDDAWPALAQAVTPILAAACRSDGSSTADVDVSSRHFSVTAVRLRLPGRPGNRVLLLVTDVTDRRALEQQLLHADKMDAIGRLAGGIAHDFNNLLTPILGYTDLVSSTLAADDARRRDLEEVATAARSATALTRQLLTFSRKQVTKPSAIDLNDVIRSLHGIVRRTIGEDISVIMDLSPTLHRTVADRNQIEQVVMNLCVNARDAMPLGGTLTISTANTALTHASCGMLGSVPPGEYATLTVSDSGTGMPPEVQAHIFEPFFTTKGPGKGTGLGLSIVHGIVKQAGGCISLTTAQGRGTSFAMYFPRTDADVAVSRDEAARPVPRANGGETVLVVEDNEGLRRLAERLLRNGGYRTIAAQNAGEALELARSFSGEIDLLLSDVVMPDVDGVTLANQLTRQRPTMRVLFMSGYTGADVARHTMLPQHAALLQKPFTRDSLLCALRTALDAAPREGAANS
jgi:PAS domain S-box-containing protein